MEKSTFKSIISEMVESYLTESLPGDLHYDYHSWDSDRSPEAPHNSNLKLINARQKEHKANFKDPKHGEAHKELHSALEDAKEATKDHLADLKRSGAFGVRDYKGDHAIDKLRKYNDLLHKQKKK